MQRNKMIIFATLAVALLASLGALLIPIPSFWPPENGNFHWQLIVNIVMACTHTGGALLLLTNLDVYKAKLRRSYRTLAIGTFITGAGTLQISILTVLDVWDTFYGQSGAVMLPFLLSGIILYVAMRSFAHLVGVTHILTQAWVVMPAVLLIAALSTFLPHANLERVSEAGYDALVAIELWSALLILSAGGLAALVRHKTGTHYTNAMAWLTRALIFSSFVLLYQAFYTLVSENYNPLLSIISNIVTVTSGLIWVRAGYAFALTKYYDQNLPFLTFLFARTNGKTKTDASMNVVDMVTTTAGLVSNSSDIDPILDDVRTITSKLKPGEQPSSSETKQLIGVYLKIEDYLIHHEALRTFTSAELRSRLNPELKELLKSNR